VSVVEVVELIVGVAAVAVVAASAEVVAEGEAGETPVHDGSLTKEDGGVLAEAAMLSAAPGFLPGCDYLIGSEHVALQ
jgi:hypothetical protein